MSSISPLLALLGAIFQAPAAPTAPLPFPAIIQGADEVSTLLPKMLKGWTKPEEWLQELTPACRNHGITTRLRLACFMANIGNETGDGKTLIENLNYTPEALMALFGQNPRKDGLPARITAPEAQLLGRVAGQHLANQEAIANRIYGGEWGRINLGNTQPGDGWRFRGRGGMQTTGRANYQRLATMMGQPLDDAFLAGVATVFGASVSAAFFFESSKMAVPADKGDITAARKIANGGTIGLPEVKARYARLVSV